MWKRERERETERQRKGEREGERELWYMTKILCFMESLWLIEALLQNMSLSDGEGIHPGTRLPNHCAIQTAKYKRR
jgi:hypothetical protein